MTRSITNDAEVIDSRDIIERIEDLENTLEIAHKEETREGVTNLDFEEWLLAVRADSSPAHCHEYNGEVEELQELRQLAAEAENSPDWTYGESLIREDYFPDYIEELINECYEMPKAFNSGEWPWRHMSLDICAAAEEAKYDYFDVTLFGAVYLIRS